MTKSVIRKKISLLKDFCVLKKDDTEKIEAVKKLLGQCDNEYEVERMLRGVLTCQYTLEDLLISKGVMQNA